MEKEEILLVNDLNVVEHLTKEKILSDLTFNVKRNEYLGIFGPSGSGKTTLLTTIMRISPQTLSSTGSIMYLLPDQKRLIIQEKDQINDHLQLSRALSYIPQNASESFDPIEKMGHQFKETFEENHVEKDEVNQHIQKLLLKMNLPESILKKYPFQLSGGTLQRCAIGLAIQLKPKIIIADEPTSALDALNKKRVLDTFFDLKKQGKTTLLLATHDVAILDYLCDRALVLENGEKVAIQAIDPFDTDSSTYLGAIRSKKIKMGAAFWRLRDEKMANS